MSDDTGPAVAVGLIIGLAIGASAVAFVTSYNANYDEVQIRKQLVNLGVGSYDSHTGAFRLKACGAQQ